MNLGVATREAEHLLNNIHIAGNNRQGILHGNINIIEIYSALTKTLYEGAIALEVWVPRQNPFNINENNIDILIQYLKEIADIHHNIRGNAL